MYLSLLGVGKALPSASVPASAEVPTLAFVRLSDDDPWSLGVLRVLRIQAPAERLQAVVNDIPGYVGIFSNLLISTRTPAAGQESFDLFTETRIPLPLVANDRTTVHYQTQKRGKNLLTSFELKESNHLASLDGASLLVSLNKTETVYWKISFLKVGFGAARALPARMFWVENAVGGLQADWALKLRTEQPALKPEEILAKSETFARGQEKALNAAFLQPLRLEQVISEIEPPAKKKRH